MVTGKSEEEVPMVPAGVWIGKVLDKDGAKQDEVCNVEKRGLCGGSGEVCSLGTEEEVAAAK